MIRMPGRSHRGPLPPLDPSTTTVQAGLDAHVSALASEIGERNLHNLANLRAAERYIAEMFRRAGYDPAVQEFPVWGETARNIEVEIAGTEVPDEIVVVGGHYDSVAGSPGANDNASGTAAVLELARLFAGHRPVRTVRFVAFVNEEPPFFRQPDAMGSRVYARGCRESREQIVAMLSLETIGCYTDAPGSQRYPFPFSLFYPDTGNFIGFVGNLASRRLVRRCVATFRQHADLPSEGAALPGWIVGVDWSDHWLFWQEGYPALMVTDTALFRYSHYHQPSDTADKLDYERTARVVTGLAHLIADLAGAALT
ncbi:MAG: aminopeptidase [Dehalococcoidia bacterium]|nr:aminopeptidase [Dehalococcoidia bacterium]